MILYKGNLPKCHFDLEGYTYLGELSETQYEDCQLIFTQQGFYDYPEEQRVTQIKGALRCLVNVKNKEIRAFTVTAQMRLCANNLSSYEHNARFFFPIEMLKANEVKKAIRAHVLACLFSFQNEIVEKMEEINGAWNHHNDTIYEQFNQDSSIDDINPRFFPKPNNDIYDVFNHTHVGLTAMGKQILQCFIKFSQEYELSYVDQLKELADEFELPIMNYSLDDKCVA